MSKKQVRRTGGARRPAASRPVARPARPPHSNGKTTREASRGGGALALLHGHRPALPILIATALAAALVVVNAVAYDPDLIGTYYIPRAALTYPLVAALVVVALIAARPGLRSVSLDLIDLLALGLAGWLGVSALLSPASAPAWFGYYNRGTGAFFGMAVLAVFLVARRLLSGGFSERLLAPVASGTLVLTAIVALAQNAGADTWWGAAGVVDGRATGTTGNPVNLAGLCLLGVWLAVLALEWRTALWLRLVVAIGAAASGVCLVLGVSRAAYLGVLVGAAVVGIAWLRRREWRRLAVVGALVVVAVVGAAVYSPQGGRSLLQRVQDWRVAGSLNESDAKRLDFWGEAVKAVGDRPLAGVGPGAFVVADRLYRPVERRILAPWALASDPHSLPLLVVATTGVVGALLMAALVAAAGLALIRRGRTGSGEGDAPPPAAGSRSDSGWHRLAALAYLATAAAFLLVSPLDAVVAFPVAVVAGALLGRPVLREAVDATADGQAQADGQAKADGQAQAGGQAQADGRTRRDWLSGLTVPALSPGAGRVVSGGLVAVAGAACLVAIWAGVQYWRADAAFAAAARVDSPAQYRQAADLFSWEPFYSLEAGGRSWRAGLQAKAPAEVQAGRSLIERGLSHDETGPLGYADLARLAIAQREPRQGVAQLKRGLRWNPDHPILQGLWGYAALLAVDRLKDKGLGRQLATELERLPVSTPDGWYWLGEVRKALGDTQGSAQARAEAKRLAPKLTAHRYGQRLLAGG